MSTELDKSDTSWMVAMVILLFAGHMFSMIAFGSIIGERRGRKEVYQKAVEMKVGKYVANDKGEVTFQWITPNKKEK